MPPWLTLMAMSTISTLVSGVVDVLPQIVLVSGTLGGVVLTHRFGERQRARERARDTVSSTNKKIEELGQELFEAVGALHLALRVHVPAYNSWQPKLMTLASAFLEYMAAKPPAATRSARPSSVG